MAVTMEDVARYAAVSTATVSRVLNKPDMVNEETRQQVLDAIRALNYHMNRAARSLRTSRTYRMAVVVAEIGNPLTARVLEAFEDTALYRYYSVQLCIAHGDETRTPYYIEMLTQQNGVDGVIWMSPHLVPAETALEHLSNTDIPVVWVNAGQQPMLGFDYESASYQAAKHLLQAGHRHIALLIRSEGFRHVAWMRGYETALAEAGLTVDPMLIFDMDTEWDMLLAALGQLTGVIAYDDAAAAKLYQACAELGISIPHQLSIIGGGDYPLLRCLHPALTTFRFPAAELGKKAFELLLTFINREADFKESIYLQPELIIRDSVSALS